MHQEQFERELKNLAAMVATWDADELFTQEYEVLLTKIKAGTDQASRVEQVTRMRKLLMMQAEFLIKAWLAAKRDEGNIQ